MPTNTLLHRLYEWSIQNPNVPAQAYLNNNNWQFISVKALVQKIEKLAQFLYSIGIRENDIGVIYSYNKPEWVQFDLALMLVGASSAGVYTNASIGQIEHILRHSEAKILIVDNIESLNKISDLLGANTSLIQIIVIDPQNNCPVRVSATPLHNKKLTELAISLNEVFQLQVSEKTFNPTYQDFLNQIKLSQRAMLIYTSGTTGQSKAVSLSHQNLNFAAECYAASWEAPKVGRLFSFLPLAHVAERITNLGIGIANQYTVYFCSDPMSIAAEMREVEPTIALAVPRLWDKFKESVEKQLLRAPKRRQKLVRWAMANAKKYQNLKVGNKFISPLLRLKYCN